MAYIREKKEELTGYQEGVPFRPSIDLQCDFVMVYGTDPDMPQRVREYKEKGYVVHLMTGISWGQYQDYLDGEWDGRRHWDEAQVNRNGEQIIHNPTVPYMVPTISFTNYLVEKLKTAIDSGVEALHLEEPEFWNYGGYSQAFQREYQIFYKESWQPPHRDTDTRYKTSRLMAYLYKRAVERISAELKEYAMVQYGRDIPFYVPTHSLLNYTQWKIMSPEAALIDIPSVDGCIAQIWTGTSRTANMYEGLYKERTFETAYLEYGIMQELVRGTGRKMWFLHDPIEDGPGYRWENYRYNYLKTVVASFLHPEVSRYEICPWPHRVFDGVYPRIQPNIAQKDETSIPAPDAEKIPQEYATLLSAVIQLCGDMDQPEYCFEGMAHEVGILMSDSGMYQRTFADGIAGKGISERLNSSAVERSDGLYEFKEAEMAALPREIAGDTGLMLDFIQSSAFPQFYGMAMPLLKYGLAVRPVQLDNISRFAGYLEPYTTLILSYEYIKPASPDINASIAAWIRGGGTLLYIGDGSDPFHTIESFWQKAGYHNPAQHLFELCGIPFQTETGSYTVGLGKLHILRKTPAELCLSKVAAEEYREMVKAVLETQNFHWEYSNSLTIHRGPYLISAVMDESVSGDSKVFTGLYSDMLENDFKIIGKKEVKPDENTILFDYETIKDRDTCIVGTSARIYEMDVRDDGVFLEVKAADRIKAFLRLRLPQEVVSAAAVDEAGREVELACDWDTETRTVLFCYESQAKGVKINGKF